LNINRIPVFVRRAKSPQFSKKGELIGIFPLTLSALAGKADDIFILLVRESQDVDVTAIRQTDLDSAHIRLELVFAVAETSIHRKLAFLETFIEQEFPEFGRGPTLGLCAYR
jgi:hypothetical protein